MKTKKKWFMVYALLSLMLVMLTACGAKSTGVEGTYRGAGMSYSGLDMDLDGDANYIELKNGGKGTISLEGTKESLKWKTDDNAAFTFTIEGDDYNATLDNGTLTLDLLGINYIYKGENGAGSGISASDSKGSDTAVSAKSGSVLDRLHSLAGGGEPYVPEDADPRINNVSYGAGSDYSWDPTWGHEGFVYDGD